MDHGSVCWPRRGLPLGESSGTGSRAHDLNKYVVPRYCRTEMYTGCVACRPLASHGKYADGTDRQTNRQTDARPLQYAFRQMWPALDL